MKIQRRTHTQRRDDFEATQKGSRVRITAHRHTVLIDAECDGKKTYVEMSLPEFARLLHKAIKGLPERDMNLP